MSIPHIETDPGHYQFIYPVCTDIFDSLNYYPPNQGVYNKATYGFRYLSNTAGKSDNHGGFDYWNEVECDGVAYDDAMLHPILCMCDGIVSEVIHGPDSIMELTPEGRSVQVLCDSLHQSLGSNIWINYRHLSGLGPKAVVADTAAPNSVSISKGDTIGWAGESGITSNVHLHLSAESDHPDYGHFFMNTARIFDPEAEANVLRPLDHARMELLQDWPDSALFRIIWPWDRTLNRIQFENGSFSETFDFEAAYDTGSPVRDQPGALPGFSVYAYQFNGFRTAKYRYDLEKPNMPAFYPASPQRDTNLTLYNYTHFPITHDSVAYVYDVVVHDLPMGHDPDSFVVRMSDVWGYTVQGDFGIGSGVEVDKAQEMRLLPNPTTGTARLQIEETNLFGRCTVTDLSGKTIWRLRANGEKEIVLPAGEWPAGIYLVRFEAGNGKIQTRRLVVQPAK
ncbi:MAG: T9SS type A sorting domain-containing protein [Bacteroidota bacterium]